MITILVLLSSSMVLFLGEEKEHLDHTASPVWASDDPIRIDGNADLISQASSNDWQGNGSEGYPYIIENMTYSNISEDAISISNVSLHFTVRNCSLNNSSMGIDNCTNATISGNHFFGSGSSFSINECNISVISNVMNGSGSPNPFMIEGCDNSEVLNNTVTNCGSMGIYLHIIYNTTIRGNNCSYNGQAGIGIHFARNLLIENNTCNYNSYYAGIDITYPGGSNCGGHQIRNNTCMGNHHGIGYLEGWGQSGIESNITGNKCTENLYDGILIAGDARAVENRCDRNGRYGISIKDDIWLMENSISHNGLGGINIIGSDNMISGNGISSNRIFGMDVQGDRNNISNNTFERSHHGIFVNGSSNNIIENNTFQDDNNVSIMESNSSYNRVVSNRFFLRDRPGIHSINSSGTFVSDNEIYGNSSIGIHLKECSSSELSGNELIYNGSKTSVRIENCAMVDITDNEFRGGDVSISDSLVIDLERNNFTDMGVGLNLEVSSVNAVSNTFQNAGVNISTFSRRNPWIENVNIGISNTVNGGPIRLIKNEGGAIYDNESTGQYILWNTRNTTIGGFSSKNAGVGIQVFETVDAKIFDCLVRDSNYGIKAIGTRNTTIRNTEISSCGDHGIYMLENQAGSITGNLIRSSPTIDSDNRYHAGIVLSSTDDLEIHGNTLFADHDMNLTRAMFLDQCFGCDIWDNYFFFYGGTNATYDPSRTQVYDINGNNQWTSPEGKGNYFRDNTEPDNDGDGSVDVPYLVGARFGLDLFDTGPMTTCPVVAPPEDLGATPSADMLYLNWTEPEQIQLTNVISYNIYRGTDEENIEYLNTVNAPQANYFDYDVQVNVTYYYYVTAENELIEGDPSMIVSAGLDTEKPYLNITSPLNNSYISSKEVEVIWEMNDSQSGIMHVEIALDNGEFVHIGNSTEYLYRGLSEGEHTVRVKVWDMALRWNMEYVNFTVDTEPMFLNITSPPMGSILNGEDTLLTWSYRDNTSGAKRFELYSTNGTMVYSGQDTQYLLTGVPDGEHLFRLIGTDRAGNKAYTNISFRMDATTPDLFLVTPEDGLLTRSGDIRVEWRGEDMGSGIETFFFRLNEFEWEDLGPSRQEKTLWQLNDGRYTILVKAQDRAGNVNIVSSTIVVDATRPELRIISPHDNSYLSESPISIKWNGTDATSGLDHFEISLDGQNWLFKGSNTSYTIVNPKEGSHVVSIRMYDKAGNMATVSTGFVLDQTTPEAESWGPTGNDVKVDATPYVIFSERMDKRITQFKVSDVDGRVVWKGDRVIFTPNSKLSYGTQYNVSVVSWDLAGNRMRTLTWEFTTDNTGSLSGHITDKSGNFLRNVRITLESGRSTISREDGYFYIQAEGGAETLTLEADGYETVQIDVLVTPGQDNHMDRIVMSSKEGKNMDWTTLLIISATLIISLGAITIIGVRIRSRGGFDMEE
ncbi:MAG: right-handed parallel beta-helix repeat-containing protein [Thermoplasmatota archaeon]